MRKLKEEKAPSNDIDVAVKELKARKRILEKTVGFYPLDISSIVTAESPISRQLWKIEKVSLSTYGKV